MVVFGYPVRRNPAGDFRKDKRREIRDFDPGENKESGIIGNEVKVFGTGLDIPADEGISWGNFPGGGAKEKTGEWFIEFVGNKIFNIFADSGREAEVMIFRDKTVEKELRLFINDGRNKNGPQIFEV